MAGYDIWDIVKVPFPYTNRPVQQYRPALVVAHLHRPGMPELLWVLMITSATHRRWPDDVDIEGLPAPSVVRCAKIATIEAKDAVKIGQLGDRSEVEAFLRRALALEDGADDRLNRIALAVEQDEKLTAEMEDWAATVDDEAEAEAPAQKRE